MPESSNIESSRGKKFEVPPKLDKILNDAEWYKKVIETMADGVIATDMNQTIVYVNTKLLKMLRYSSEELLGTNSYAIVVEEDRNKVIRETERRYQEKSSTQYEVSMKSKYGTKIPVLITGTPILAEGGETIGTYALVTDISDRKLVEKELRNKNIELQTLYNNLLQLYEQLGSILAETTNIHTEIYLFTSKECVYCAPAEEVLQEVLAAYGGKITYRKVDIDEEPELAEKYEVMSLPTIAIGEEKLTAVPDMYKLHSALFSALVPEEKFRRTRQELDNIITYSPIAIFTINNEGILTSANPLVEMMMGKKRSDLIGKNIIFSNGKGEKIKNHDLLKLLKKGLNGENTTVNRLIIKERIEDIVESFAIISLKIVPIHDKEDKVSEILVLSEDVTQLALQEEELAESYTRLEELNDKLLQLNKDRSNFVEVTSTKLLEPLRNSRELIDQILSGQLGEMNDEIVGTIEYLRINLENVSKSILDFLEFSTLETQGFTLKPQNNKVRNLVSETTKEIGSIGIDKGFVAVLNVPEELTAFCDKDQIIRVLKNLLINAIKFTEMDVNIEISAKNFNKNMVSISIKDNGIGIAKRDLKRIFDQYEKVDPLSSGSGLGLTVVKSLVEAHGGTVTAFSEGLSKGSTFTFTLPRNKKTYEKLIAKKKDDE